MNMNKYSNFCKKLSDLRVQVVFQLVKENVVPFSDKFLCSKCIDERPQISINVIDISEAKTMVQQRYQNFDAIKLASKQQLLKHLQIFQQKMMDARSQFIQKIVEILRISEEWITVLQNFGKKTESLNLIQELEHLSQNVNVENIEEDEIENMKRVYLEKMNLAFQELFKYDEFKKYSDCLKSVDIPQEKPINQSQTLSNNIETTSIDKVKVDSLLPITTELIQSVKQSQYSGAIAFNNSGSIMVAAYNEDLKVWRFDRGDLIEQQRLKGHTQSVLCLAFSKKCNWFASGSSDKTIRCWKEYENNTWIEQSLSPLPFFDKQHINSVMCIILNRNEDQLISCSCDETIKVWNVNCQKNQLKFCYTLQNKHTRYVYSLSMNESETALVSCSQDKQIILWVKGQNQKWEYKNHTTNDDYGFKICFISNNQIAWQQSNKGFTHIFEIENGKLIEKPELKIKLKQGNSDEWLFPTIFNKSKEVMIQRYGQHVYILRTNSNGQFNIESEPIDCKNNHNFGKLTEDGEYLIIWNYGTKEFHVYRIFY